MNRRLNGDDRRVFFGRDPRLESNELGRARRQVMARWISYIGHVAIMRPSAEHAASPPAPPRCFELPAGHIGPSRHCLHLPICGLPGAKVLRPGCNRSPGRGSASPSIGTRCSFAARVRSRTQTPATQERGRSCTKSHASFPYTTCILPVHPFPPLKPPAQPSHAPKHASYRPGTPRPRPAPLFPSDTASSPAHVPAPSTG